MLFYRWSLSVEVAMTSPCAPPQLSDYSHPARTAKSPVTSLTARAWSIAYWTLGHARWQAIEAERVATKG
eukprot:3975497-Alexandrium_andersonii.AAC.1